MKVHTTENLAGMMTKCLRSPVRCKLFDVLDAMANELASAFARHLGGTLMGETIRDKCHAPSGS